MSFATSQIPAGLMASAMGGVSSLASVSSASNPTASSPSSSKGTKTTTTTTTKAASSPGSIRIFYSLKENPNAIISYADLMRQELRKRQRVTPTTTKNNTSSGPLASPLKPKGTTSSTTAASSSSTTTTNGSASISSTGTATATVTATGSDAMDVDPVEGEEALGDGDDSEAEDDDEAEEDDDNDEEAEAEDEEAEDDEEGDGDEDEDEEEDDPDEPGVREPRDFLEALTAKYGGLDENGNEGEDEDEDEDEEGKGIRLKRPSRWDTEHYDIEDEFIDDSEMMLEAIGMVRPKVDGFFVYRGPVETTTEDPDSSDAVTGTGSRAKRTVKRKTAAGASPLSTSKPLSKTGKGTNLAVVDNAVDSTSDMSEVEDKPKASSSSTAANGSGVASGTGTTSALSADSGAGNDGGSNSVTSTPTKKRAAPSKAKTATAVGKDSADASKDSDKESKAGTGTTKKRVTKPKASAAATTVAPTSTLSTTAPVMRVDSLGLPEDDSLGMMDDASADQTLRTTPQPRSRASSPSKSKSKSTLVDGITTPATTASPSGRTKLPDVATLMSKSGARSKPAASAGIDGSSSKSKHPRAPEPLNEEVQAAFDVVAKLAKQETWEVKTKFPVPIKAPLFECARIALATRSSGYVLDDGFFLHLQTILPYNKFTLKKLTYKNVLPGWINELEAQKAQLLEQFKARVKKDWEVAGYAGLERNPPQTKDGDGDLAMAEEGKPQRKFPWTQNLRLLLWETMEKFMEILAARVELRAIDESNPIPVSESKTRKDAYQTLLASFPVGWMSSYEISRQYSQLKEKVQKQEKREVGSASPAAPPPPAVEAPVSQTPIGAATASASSEPAATTDLPAAAVAEPPSQPPAQFPHLIAGGGHRTSPSPAPSGVGGLGRVPGQLPDPTLSSSSSRPPQQQHLSFSSGTASTAAGKKRKKTEEVSHSAPAAPAMAVYDGRGSSADPVVISEGNGPSENVGLSTYAPTATPGYRSSAFHNGSSMESDSQRRPPFSDQHAEGYPAAPQAHGLNREVNYGLPTSMAMEDGHNGTMMKKPKVTAAKSTKAKISKTGFLGGSTVGAGAGAAVAYQRSAGSGPEYGHDGRPVVYGSSSASHEIPPPLAQPSQSFSRTSPTMASSRHPQPVSPPMGYLYQSGPPSSSTPSSKTQARRGSGGTMGAMSVNNLLHHQPSSTSHGKGQGQQGHGYQSHGGAGQGHSSYRGPSPPASLMHSYTSTAHGHGHPSLPPPPPQPPHRPH